MNRSFPVFLAVLLLLAGCSKKLIPAVPTAPPTIEIQEIDFEYFHGKARMVYKDDKKERDVKVNLRIRKDSVIWMTVSQVGVQGARVLINHDSVTILSTLEKEYYVFTYAELSRRFNFDINYQTIQSAILGNLISTRQPDDLITPGTEFNMLDQTRKSVKIRNSINASTRKLEKVEMSEASSSNNIVISYSDFQPVGDKFYPYKGFINILYRTASGLLNTSITLEYTKAEVGDKELKFPFNIPKRYDRR